MKIKYSESEDTEMIKIFDYTFDYILVKLETVSLQYIVDLTNINIHTIQTILERTGYKLYHQDNECFVTDFPVHSPIIIEIMTSSTSGGNKKYRSTIPLAFEDALLKIHHNGPGINYRQVWARMVSQLL